MNNITIARETIAITKDRRYVCEGRNVSLPDINYEEVVVIDPDTGAGLVEELSSQVFTGDVCSIKVTTEDTYEAGLRYDNAVVLNFANAHHPGGGFLHGANAQEEALCRASTLYASISSDEASAMYRYNNTHLSKVESDHMLLSPNVAVIRGEGLLLRPVPRLVGVITAPAPNRRGAALLASQELIRDTFVRRIRIILAIACHYGYRNIVLGAWGCGAFGNDPVSVAEYHRQVIVDEGFGKAFDEITFAVYGREDGKNYLSFKKVFGII